MRYKTVFSATFLARPNRFIALVEHEGQTLRVHVKNTGRCAELLVPGCTVYLTPGENPARKTPFDLIAVQKGELLINMDSAAPNRAVGEWLAAGGLGQLDRIKPEHKLGDSRFDFYARRGEQQILMEVKGCTLETEGLACFPDAPTLRGLKHVQELTALAKQGWECYVFILVQMKGVYSFAPNWVTQPAFGHALQAARAAGVTLLCYDCTVTSGSLTVSAPVPIDLTLPASPEAK